MTSIITGDTDLPDMEALHKTNDLIPDPNKLKKQVIPAEDIAGWFLPFEMVFGMVYWETWGAYLALAFVGTILFGWIIPMQQRFALLAKAEFMKERTQLGHLTWEEQCEIIKFEPILEPTWKYAEDGKPILDEDDDLIPDELDTEEWVTTLDLEGRIVEHEDGMLTSMHTLDNKFIASTFKSMFEASQNAKASFEHDKLGWFILLLAGLGKYIWANAPMWFVAFKKGFADFVHWINTHKLRLSAAVTLGFVVILFSNWLGIITKFILQLLGWDMP